MPYQSDHGDGSLTGTQIWQGLPLFRRSSPAPRYKTIDRLELSTLQPLQNSKASRASIDESRKKGRQQDAVASSSPTRYATARQSANLRDPPTGNNASRTRRIGANLTNRSPESHPERSRYDDDVVLSRIMSSVEVDDTSSMIDANESFVVEVEAHVWRCLYPSCTSTRPFARRCDLRKHIRRHFKHLFCRVPDCPKSEPASMTVSSASGKDGVVLGKFSSEKDRARHEAKHDPRIRCQWQFANGQQCTRLFSRKDNMQDHVKRVHLRT